MNPSQNSRRNFLGLMAILTSGTVVAGSPMSLFDNKNNNTSSPEQDWELFIKHNTVSPFLNITGINLPDATVPIAGHHNKTGNILHFTKDNMLAQATWIYWGNDRSKADDVVIGFYEPTWPYKKIKSVNRFELHTLAKMIVKDDNKHLLKSLCTKKTEGNNTSLVITTNIKKNRKAQLVSLYKNNSTVLKEQFFYNV